MDKGLCDEEDWNIKDCIVVEDGKAANPVGRVIKIDGAFAAVKFTNNIDPVDDPLLNVRLLRKEDLQVWWSSHILVAATAFMSYF